ncbi:hypothetical protein K040078D81_27170 [Blautia hominis]|uniref:Uncharacterized protein n=1 Tax=Blautia hominis TaxID=2025493 RepID=A0ABQ0BAW2_9FIRM
MQEKESLNSLEKVKKAVQNRLTGIVQLGVLWQNTKLSEIGFYYSMFRKNGSAAY